MSIAETSKLTGFFGAIVGPLSAGVVKLWPIHSGAAIAIIIADRKMRMGLLNMKTAGHTVAASIVQTGPVAKARSRGTMHEGRILPLESFGIPAHQ